MAEVTVEGTVSRLNASGNGFGVKEIVTFGDKSRTTYWSVFPPRGVDRFVQVGDSVKVTGGLGAKVSERDPRYVDYTINNAQVQTEAPVNGGGWEVDGSEVPF